MQRSVSGFSDNALSGKRILVVEDSPVVADVSAVMLEDMGCLVRGPAVNLASALQLAEAEELDAAIVDINIRGDKAYGVLRILQRRSIPFILTSGYANWSLPDEWAEAARLAKPYTQIMLRESLAELLSS